MPRNVLRSGLLFLFTTLLCASYAAAQKLVTGAGAGTGPSVRVIDANGTDTTFFAYDPAFPGGVRVALGDVNGDGVLDIITAAGPGGGPHVRIWDGATLTEIIGFFAYDPAFSGGVYVAAGDVNGDGRADIITGAGPGGGPHVRIWDGVTLTEIAGFFAYNPAFPGGVNVAAGDVDGDGLADIITGAGPGGGPHVRVWNGATLAEIGGFFAYDPAFPGGVNVAAGDIDGDGLADILTGAGPGGGPHVRVWSGSTLSEIGGGGFFAYDPAFAGGVTVGMSDLDRDGINEIVTGPMNGPPLVRIWTGTTFALLGEYTPYDPSAGGSGVFIGSTDKNPSLDDAPSVTATTPASGATDVAVNSDLIVTFSEAVNVTAAAFELQCGAPIALTVTTASPASTFTLHPTSPLPFATACTLRIVGSAVTDEDTVDPPNRMAGDTTISFTTSSCAAITVTPTTVPGGTINVAYPPVTFAQVGGTPPIAWTITSGTLPAGMTLSAAGVLSGTPTESGAYPLTITATATGGCTGSVSLTLNIAAAPNMAPSFSGGASQTVLEDAGPQTIVSWATGISPGPPSEAAQTVTFNITGNTNTSLFTAGPAVSPTGTLTYTPAANANGMATITLVLQDNGGTALGGVDTSPPQAFTIAVTAVNDAPAFTVGANQTVAEDAGAQTVAAWATAISGGPADEAGQTLAFNVTGNTNTALFTVQPAVSPTGTLTYTIAPNASGTATITLTLSDNGGTANGGVDTSAPQTFTITVTAVDDPPTADNDSYAVNEGGTLSVPAPGVLDGDNDPEGDPLTAVLVTGPANASSFTLNIDGSFTYTHNGSDTTTDSFTYRAVANGVQSAIATVTITVTAVNDAPAITAGGILNFVEGNPATAIDGTIAVTDPDNTNLASAAVQILPPNYVNGQDILAMPVTPGITAVFDAATGTLTLTGTATVAAYQAALRSVTYFNNSLTPSIAPRTVAWIVNDGALSSNTALSTITVTAVNSSPIGVADAWTTFGNTDLVVDQAGPSTPFVADTTTSTFGVLDNDIDPEGDPRVVSGIVGCADTTAPFDCTTTAGGSVTMESNGRFTYRPQAGDTGADSFQYVLTDVPSAGVPGSVNVPVNLTLQERIWYVDGEVAGPGTGTSSDPFSALTTTIGDADDYIFVHHSPVLGGITLQNGQKLYGEGFGLSINQALNGNAAPTVLVPAGGVPDITASSGNAVTVLANTASGNLTNIEIRGLWLSTTAASSNAIDITSADAANVAVTISDVEVLAATAEGIDINHGSTGTATLAMSNITVTSTSTGIDINETAGALTVTGFSGITVTGNTGGSGIVVANATFDATAGGGYNQVGGGAIVVGDVGNPVGGAGVVLTNVSGALASTDLDVFTAVGPALQVTGTGAVNAGAGTGTLVSVTAGVATLQSIGGPAVDINNATVNLPLDSASATASPTTGISLVNVASGTTAASVSTTSGSITNTTGISVNVQGGNVSLNYGGNITQANNVAMVSVSGGHTGGTITFSGTLNATNGPGLVFDNADSTTSYNFTGTTTLNGGDAGIDILNGSAGTFTFGTGTTITNPSGSAFQLTASTANVVFSGTISDNTGFAVDINGLTAGTATFQTGSITSTGSGIRVVNSTGGVINFNSPTIALTTGTSTGVNIGSGGPNTGGTITFAPVGGNGLDISTTTGLGFLAQQGGTVTVTGTGNTINSTGAMAIELSGVIIGAGGVNFLTTTSGGGVRNVKLTNVTGGAIALGGGSLTGSTGAAFLAGDGVSGANTGGTSAITYSGSITSTGSARAVEIQDRPAGAGNITLSGTITHGATGSANVIFVDSVAAGTITFSGANSVLNGGTSTAVSLTNNPGATINFTGGGLDIDATSGNGFHASSSGSVNVTGTGNTIVTTTGIALNVANTTIGASGMTFQSISANGAANGIVLNNTGATAGLTLTGNGGTCTSAATCSGGAIQNTTGDGLALTNTRNVLLTRLFVGGTGNHGINGNAVNTLSLTSCRVQNSGNGDNEHGLNLVNAAGTVNVDGTAFDNAAEDLVHLENNNTNVTLNVTGSSQFSYPASVSGTANSAILLLPGGTASITASIQNSTFTNIVSASAQIGANLLNSNGTQTFTFSTNTINVSLAARGSGVVISGQELTTTNITINNNSFTGAGGNGVISIDTNDSSRVVGTVSGNTIANPPGIGMFVAVDEAATNDIVVTGNTITNSGGDGIQAVNFGGAGVSAMQLAITNNQVSGHSLNTAVSFVGGISFTNFEDTACVVLRGNTVTGTPASATQCGGAPCVDYYLEEVGGVMTLEEVPNTANTTANAAYVNSINDAGPVTIFGVIDLTNGATCNVALMADGGEAPACTTAAALDEQDLGRLVRAAARRMNVADASAAEALAVLGWQVVDLPGAQLGGVAGNWISLDRDAAGWGWFVDPTPDEDEEFEVSSPATGERRAKPGGPADGRMDLLTALLHEIGHTRRAIDLDPEAHAGSLMSAKLAIGVRRGPAAVVPPSQRKPRSPRRAPRRRRHGQSVPE